MTDKPTTPDRRTMHPDVAHLLQAVQSRDDAITGLRADVQAMPDHIGRAMQDAIMRSVSDPLLWAAAGQALRRPAPPCARPGRRLAVRWAQSYRHTHRLGVDRGGRRVPDGRMVGARRAELELSSPI